MSQYETDNSFDISQLNDLTGNPEIRKHIILHFDSSNDFPRNFYTVFQLMGLSDRVTIKYEEFKRSKEKQIFICSYRTFTGLEYPCVIIFLDLKKMHFLKHFIPECLNRHTTSLHTFILNKNIPVRDKSLHKIIETWKAPQQDNTQLVN